MPRTTLALAFSLALSAAACGGPQYAFAGSPRVESADGLVEVEVIEGTQRLVTLSIRGLPSAGSLGSDLTGFVVWAQLDPEAAATRLGALEYDADTRQGTFVGTVDAPAFTLIITAEADIAASSPSDVVVADRRIGDDE